MALERSFRNVLVALAAWCQRTGEPMDEQAECSGPLEAHPASDEGGAVGDHNGLQRTGLQKQSLFDQGPMGLLG